MNIKEIPTTFAVRAARGFLRKSPASIQSETGTTGKAPHILQDLASGLMHP